MNVALYCPQITQFGDVYPTIVELTRRSRHTFTLFTHNFDSNAAVAELDGRKVQILPRIPVDREITSVARAMWTIVSQSLPLEQFDALLVIGEGLGDLIVLRNRQAPVVCLCLSPLRIAFDPAYREKTLSKWSFTGRWAIELGCKAFHVVDFLAWQRFRRVICVSEGVKGRVLKGWLANHERLEVARPGSSFETRPGTRVFERFFLLPDRLKNSDHLDAILAAFDDFQKRSQDFADFSLVICASQMNESSSELRSLEQKVAGKRSIELRLNAADSELQDLYRTCYTVISRNDDWPAVALQAMSFGKPVIALDCEYAREIVTHGKDGYIEQPDAKALADRMVALASDPFQAFVVGLEGFKKAKAFSWDEFIARVDDMLEDILPVGHPKAITHGNRIRAAK